MLTNLPPSVDAVTVADLYRGRWAIDTAFQELAAHLNSEIDTPGYPGAAPFAFAVAVTLYNAVALTRAALAVHHGATPVDEDRVRLLRRRRPGHDHARDADRHPPAPPGRVPDDAAGRVRRRDGVAGRGR